MNTVFTMRKSFDLFWSFLKIGIFTFGGGYAMVALIEKEVVDRRRWVERTEFLDLLTLAQTSPGALALNTAVSSVIRSMGTAGSVVGVGRSGSFVRHYSGHRIVFCGVPGTIRWSKPFSKGCGRRSSPMVWPPYSICPRVGPGAAGSWRTGARRNMVCLDSLPST